MHHRGLFWAHCCFLYIYVIYIVKLVNFCKIALFADDIYKNYKLIRVSEVGQFSLFSHDYFGAVLLVIPLWRRPVSKIFWEWFCRVFAEFTRCYLGLNFKWAAVIENARSAGEGKDFHCSLLLSTKKLRMCSFTSFSSVFLNRVNTFRSVYFLPFDSSILSYTNLVNTLFVCLVVILYR